MKYLIVGAGGQLATELERQAPVPEETGSLSWEQLDITDEHQVRRQIGNLRPAVVLNAAAWTDVDGAEGSPAAAFAVNRDGPAHLAAACQDVDALLVQVSTDFIFSGEERSPYTTDAVARPLGVYGASKLAGEEAVVHRLPQSSLIVRTAWLYSPHGKNFVKTMMNVMREREELRVVADQRGTPTSASSLARALWQLVDADERGVHHWTDGGEATWYEFAVAIHELARGQGILHDDVRIEPIETEEWPTPAARPRYSVLDTSRTVAAVGYAPRPWRDELSEVISQLNAVSDRGMLS